jgi:hypothetical protein
VKAPNEDELAGAWVFVQRPGTPIPIDAEWHVLTDGRVLTRFRESGGWEKSMFDAEQIAAGDGPWIPKR